MVSAYLDRHDRWVIDGNYRSLSYERRMEEADRIVELLFPPLTALGRVLRRRHRYAGRSRPDMPDGCPEKVDGEFIRWVLWDGRSRKNRERYRRIRERYPDKTVCLRSQRQIDRFFAEIGGKE